jgi:flagellar basal-body rod protein FlgB
LSGLFDKTTQALGTSMNMRLLRHNLTSSNIANSETPGYQAKKMDFENSLSRALELDGTSQMSASHRDHFPVGRESIEDIRADVYDNPDINMANDKNTVEIEKEMATLAENQIQYRAATELIKKKLGALKYAISEGGR